MLVDALVAANLALEARGVRTRIGAEHLGTHLGIPRVIWVMAEGSGRSGMITAGVGRDPQVQRSIGTRVARVDAHLWARRVNEGDPLYFDYKALEQLSNWVQVDLRKAVGGGGSYAFLGERYPEGETGEQVAQHGRRMILALAVETPVVDDAGTEDFQFFTPTDPEQLESSGYIENEEETE